MNGKIVTLLVGSSLILVQTGCRDSKESAREELQQSGYDLTPEAFFRAAESDDTSNLAALIENGIALETRDADGNTALHRAAAAGMKKSADFFLDQGVAVDVLGADERTPLMMAVLKGSPEMVRYLLSQKADPLKKDAKGYRPLMLAVSQDRADMVRELAAYDRQDLDVALLVASLEGKASVIDELTNYGASIYARMEDGRTPLMLAAENGHIEAVEMLLEIGANRFSMDSDGRIAADVAREAGHNELAARLSEAPTEAEFELEEPADLGAEMLASVTEAEDAPAADHVEVLPNPTQGEGSPDKLPHEMKSPALLDGVTLTAAPEKTGSESSNIEAPAPVVMRAFSQKELPLRVESVDEETATMRISGGGVQRVETGTVIPGSRLKIVSVQTRMQETKDSNAGPTEVSVVEVEDTDSGRRRELVSGIASTAHDPVALVEDASGDRYLAKAGQRFRGADGSDYLVNDVRPNQMVIENLTTGEVRTVPLRGPRG